MKLMLNMIVKNESARIERALASVVPFIDSWIIVDTGSTDDTKSRIYEFFKAHKIPGEIYDAGFEDWSQARNEALRRARSVVWAYEPDYLLLMDADMELRVRNQSTFFGQLAGGDCYTMYQRGGNTKYTNARLVKATALGVYRGVTHEYLDVTVSGNIPEDVAYFDDHADGANRNGKYARDISLLKGDLRKDPGNLRTWYYLGQSYLNKGDMRNAAKWFKLRAGSGGWDEEKWQAQVHLAHCYKESDPDKFVAGLLTAYHMRPSRAEPMFDLAHYYRHKSMQAPAMAAAEAVEHLPMSTDSLFVNQYVYDVGIAEEMSICAYYVPGKADKGYKVSSALAMRPGPYGGVRDLARGNLFFYVRPLSKFCPSFEWGEIEYGFDDGWVALNPSVASLNGELWCNIRTVNYRIDENGSYIIRGTDGTANATNPIHTRNFLARLAPGRPVDILGDAREVLPPAGLPCEFPLVVGFEDTRLIPYRGEMWTSSTVRQIHPDGNCEQVLARIDTEDIAPPVYRYRLGNVKRMLRQPRETEKNWSPIIEESDLRFMWRPLEIVDTNGVTQHMQTPDVAVDNVSGSSQVIPFRYGWLAITHEARTLPGSHLRWYYHRFAYYDEGFSKVRFSRPFYFNDKAIEFCAGMCWHPGENSLVISYGHKDCSARIATVSATEVEKFLWLDRPL